MGKTLLQESSSQSITYLEHYVPFLQHQHHNLTPRRQPLILPPCTHCSLNSYFSHDLRPKCVIAVRTSHTLLFKIHARSASEHKAFSNLISVPYFVSTKPLFSIRHLAYEKFLLINNISLPQVTAAPIASSSDTARQLLLIKNQIFSALLCQTHIKQLLLNIASNFIDFSHFTFYTDGAVKYLGSDQC